MPTTAVCLGGESGNTRRRVTFDSEHGRLAGGTTSARRTDHGCNVDGGPTKGRVSTGASGYPDCHIVVFNGMIYMFEATGKPHQEWSSASRIAHIYVSLFAGIIRSDNRTSGSYSFFMALFALFVPPMVSLDGEPTMVNPRWFTEHPPGRGEASGPGGRCERRRHWSTAFPGWIFSVVK